jgi:parallel beta-helix repeat protein
MLNHSHFRRTVFILLVLILSLSPLASVFALPSPDTVYVDETFDDQTAGFGYTHFAEIQSAVNMVAEGGTIHVAAGTYFAFSVGKPGISVLGAKGAIIDGEAYSGDVQANLIAYGIYVEAADVVIEGFTVQNWPGAGIYLSVSTNYSEPLARLQIIDPEPDYAMNADINGNVITHNLEGIIAYGNNNTVRNNTVTENSYSGIIVLGENCTIDSNSVSEHSYEGIGWSGSNFTIVNNRSFNNMLGLYAEGGNHSFIKDNVLTENEAGIVILGEGNTVLDNTVQNNSAVGIYSLTISRMRIRGEGNDFPAPADNEYIANTVTKNGGQQLSPAKVSTLDVFSVAEEPDVGGGIMASTGNVFRSNHIAKNIGYGLFAIDWKMIAKDEQITDPEMVPVDAILNWWGHTSGPFHVDTNPFASGQTISDNALYSPWLLAEPSAPEPVETRTELLGEGESVSIDGAISARVVSGEGTVTVGQYAANPTSKSLLGSAGFYGDVYITSPHNIDELVVYLFYTGTPENEEDLVLHWWNGSNWIACSDSGVDLEGKYVWAVIHMDTIPTLSDLTGTEFGAGQIQPADDGDITPPDKDEELPHTGGVGMAGYGLLIMAAGFYLTRKRSL